MLWRYSTSSGLTVFTYLVDLSVVTVAIPYFFSAIAQLTFLVSKRRRVQGWQLARDLSVAGASVLFSMWVTFASGYQVVYRRSWSCSRDWCSTRSSMPAAKDSVRSPRPLTFPMSTRIVHAELLAPKNVQPKRSLAR